MSGDSAIQVMCEVWEIMNGIRARDGVPRMFDGRHCDISQEYWDDLMNRLDAEVKEKTGRDCWLHPCLYRKT